MPDSIIAIDPGSEFSGFCLIDAKTYRPIHAGKTKNKLLLDQLRLPVYTKDKESIEIAIEMIGHYGTGMPAGKTVFDTCVWIGRFLQYFEERDIKTTLLMRNEIKMNLCQHPRANDSTIRQALADRFAPNEKNYGKGTKKSPGWFYGFAADVWQAYAVGVTYLDSLNRQSIIHDKQVSGEF